MLSDSLDMPLYGTFLFARIPYLSLYLNLSTLPLGSLACWHTRQRVR